MNSIHGSRPLRILTWHIHGSYLYYLVQTPRNAFRHEFYLPVKPGRPEGYGGRGEAGGSFPWPDNVHEIPAQDVAQEQFDCVLFQSHRNYLQDQYEILSPAQRDLPKIYLEHDPPRQHPTDTHHPVDDPDILLVHVTHFNDLMWDSGRTPTRVIEHGVLTAPNVRYGGEVERGLVVVNGLASRGRRLGLDIFLQAGTQVPLDLVGMQSEALGGLGEVAHDQLAALEARYRFFFNPIRYTSLGLAVCEAMMIGMPIVGVATTEMVNVVENGKSGYLSTDVSCLIDCMRDLLRDPGEARRLGQGAQRTARERFNIERFARDWHQAFIQVCGGIGK